MPLQDDCYRIRLELDDRPGARWAWAVVGPGGALVIGGGWYERPDDALARAREELDRVKGGRPGGNGRA